MKKCGPLLLVAATVAGVAIAQSPPQEFSANPPPPGIAALLASAPIAEPQREQLRTALGKREYKTAETILVGQIAQKPSSVELLTLAARIFLLDKDPMNAAIAYKKAEKLAALDDRDRFSLALAFLGIKRGDWARAELNRLAEIAPGNMAYQYWLGRLDYDDHQYDSAVRRFRNVTAAQPEFMRGWDNLALSLEGVGRLDEALECYGKAAELNRKQAHPSPWPPLNMGILLTRFTRYDEAEKLLREAAGYDDRLAAAHFRLGVNLQKQERYDEAVRELRKAVELDPSDTGPLYSLGQVYSSQGNKTAADEAYARFKALKKTQRGIEP